MFMKPNIPKEYQYVGSFHEENKFKKWFEHYDKKHIGKKPKKNKKKNKEGK